MFSKYRKKLTLSSLLFAYYQDTNSSFIKDGLLLAHLQNKQTNKTYYHLYIYFLIVYHLWKLKTTIFCSVIHLEFCWLFFFFFLLQMLYKPEFLATALSCSAEAPKKWAEPTWTCCTSVSANLISVSDLSGCHYEQKIKNETCPNIWSNKT